MKSMLEYTEEELAEVVAAATANEDTPARRVALLRLARRMRELDEASRVKTTTWLVTEENEDVPAWPWMRAFRTKEAARRAVEDYVAEEFGDEEEGGYTSVDAWGWTNNNSWCPDVYSNGVGQTKDGHERYGEWQFSIHSVEVV